MMRAKIAVFATGILLISPAAYTPGSPFLHGGAGKQADPKTPGASRENIVAELNADLEKARQRLSADDPGAQTQSTQQRILENIDRLLKQQDPNACGSNSSNQPTQNKPAPKPEAGSPKPSPGSMEPSRATPMKPDRPKPGAVHAKNMIGSEKQARQPNNLDALRKQLEGDQHWPPLPPRHRQGMDAFGRERFLPQYEEMLRAYYRSLGESTRRE